MAGLIHTQDSDGKNQTPVSATNPLPVTFASGGTTNPNDNPATVTTGQYKLTALAVAIGSGVLVNGVVIKAKSSNAGACWIGGATVAVTDDGTGNGYKLLPGEACSFGVTNLSAIYAIGTANDVIYFEGN